MPKIEFPKREVSPQHYAKLLENAAKARAAKAEKVAARKLAEARALVAAADAK